MDQTLLLVWSLAIVCSSFTVVVCNTEVPREFLDALREIESVGVGGVCAVGDDGRSLGAYQITRAYHTDAVQQNSSLSAGGLLYTDVWGEGSVDYSEEVVRAYMCRYATQATLGRPPTYEDMARIYSGGPNGHTDNGTLEYWESFQVILGNIQQRGTQEPPVLESDECDPRCEPDQCCREDDRGQYRCFCVEELDGTGTRHMERPCEDCPVAGIDLVFVLDASGSVGSANFQLIRDFVASIATNLDIGPDNSQVGVIVFSSSAAVQFSLNTHSDINQLLSAIAAIPFTSGGTNTAAGLNLLLAQGFNGARPTSQGIPRVAIVVTDGLSNSRAATTAAAQAVHAAGVTVFAVGIGNANPIELDAIASRPEFVELITGFNTEELLQLQEILTREACRASTEPAIGVEIERSLSSGSKAFFEYEVPEDGFTIRVEVTEGVISICGSREIERPDCSYSPTYDWRRDITVCTEVFITGSVNTTTVVHVTVEGLDTNNTFSLNTTFGDTTSAICPHPPEIDHGSVNINGNCIAICPYPPEINHGSVIITGNCIGDYAHYTCDPGFKLKGDPYLTCEKLDNYTAAFQPNPPVCHPLCPDPPEIDYGMVEFTGNCINGTANYSCKKGFELDGPPYTTCVKVDPYNAEFSPAPPVCIPSDCDCDPCDENAECIELPGVGNFKCRCIPPFQGDGFSCTCPSGGGDDPHFSIVLPTGQLLCFTVQGEHNFAFNLISNEKVHMNAMFLPDSRRSEVTWMGSIGITAMNSGYKKSNATSLRFVAKENKVYIGDKVVLRARNVEKLTFTNGKLTISEAPPVDGFKYPEVLVDLHDVFLSFSIKFMNEHLDIFWHSTGVQSVNSHGLIGQFFRKGIEIDEVRKILIMPNKEPVPVMRRPVWSFMEREMKNDQLCWTAMNPGYQGEGLIDGTYFDYLVNHVLSTEFQFKKQQ